MSEDIGVEYVTIARANNWCCSNQYYHYSNLKIEASHLPLEINHDKWMHGFG